MNLIINDDFKMDHVGIAVKSIESAFQFYRALGFRDNFEIERVETEQVTVAMLELANQCRVELLEPLNNEGPVQKFIEKRGEGIHHICYGVESLSRLIPSLVASGVRLINEKPRMGAHNCRVVFVHPKSAGGVLVELSEKCS